MLQEIAAALQAGGIGMRHHPSHDDGGALHVISAGEAGELEPHATILTNRVRLDDGDARDHSVDHPRSQARRKAIRA